MSHRSILVLLALAVVACGFAAYAVIQPLSDTATNEPHKYSARAGPARPTLRPTLAATVSCPKSQECATTVSDGGAITGPSGSVKATMSTSSGRAAVTQIQALDFGAPLDPAKCSGVVSKHYEYGVLSNGGSDRRITTSITTKPFPGFVQEFCLETGRRFTQKIISGGSSTLAPAAATTSVDGSRGFQGLLADCATSPRHPLQVNCRKTPGILRRVVNADRTATTVAVLPPGYDFRAGN